ncbi:hypothetical protein [Paludisphaera mucosa]|uniref:Uncharacterized protein n=1 Tax=Paludisphaera mucosa TaxID=3030827 RepID=A0ABT6F9Y1_9BACT|nr:hypothetical protein [Paludisphaera mucosa]MDG3004198.1 hypothetical protein [Paludisphaera mucosa]
MSKKFLSVGDTLINPELLAYAVVDGDGPEGPELRLGFSSQAGGRNDLLVKGEAAGEILRWLRLNADFLTKQGTFGPNGPTRHAHREYRRLDPPAALHELPPALGRSPDLVGRY